MRGTAPSSALLRADAAPAASTASASSSSSALLQARTAVGTYAVSGKLGEGTFGVVLKASHRYADERVAVKVLEKRRMQQDAGRTTSSASGRDRYTCI